MFPHEHHRASGASRRRGASIARLITPLAVVALVAVTAWLEFATRAAERSRWTAAENSVREYAQGASSKYSKHIAVLLQSHLVASTSPVRDLRLQTGQPLPPPSMLTDHAWRCRCGVVGDVLFAFRYDFDDGKLVPDRDLVPRVLRRLAMHVPQTLPQITENATSTRNGSDGSGPDGALRQTALVTFDTLASQPFVLTYGLVTDATNRPRALYGVATDPKHLREEYERLVRTDTLLPASVAKGRPNDSLLVVRVADATTGTIFEKPAPLPAGAVIHVDTMEAWLGGQVITVAIRPELSNELLVGDPPAPPRPLQLTLLAVAAVLSMLALTFRRRGRGFR